LTVQDVDFVLQRVSSLLELGTELSDFRFFLQSEGPVVVVESFDNGVVVGVSLVHLSLVFSKSGLHGSSMFLSLFLHRGIEGFNGHSLLILHA